MNLEDLGGGLPINMLGSWPEDSGFESGYRQSFLDSLLYKACCWSQGTQKKAWIISKISFIYVARLGLNKHRLGDKNI